MTSNTVTFRSPADLPAVVETFLGFRPSESLVVLGIGGGPSARVDIEPDTVASAVIALQAAAQHWTRGVVVAVYSDTVEASDVERQMRRYLPAVQVMLIADVDQFDNVIDSQGNVHAPTTPAGLPARHARPSRESIVADAERETSAGAAWGVAVNAYRAGDGAKSWIYLDRFHALCDGERTVDSLLLTYLLTNAVDPKSDGARPLLG